MPSAAIAGYKGKLLMSFDGGTTYTAFAEIKKWSLKITTDLGDATSHDSGGFAAKVPTIADWSATVDALYIESDTVAEAIFAQIAAGTSFLCKFQPSGTLATKTQYVGLGSTKDLTIDSDAKDLAQRSINIEGAGPLTRSAQ